MVDVTFRAGWQPLAQTSRATTQPRYTRFGIDGLARFTPATSPFVGGLSIAGTTLIEGTPDTPRPNTRVLLIDEDTGERVAETRSDASGRYIFSALARRRMIPIAIDDTDRHYDPAAVLGVTPTE